jgi:hypothetical protein
MPVGTITARGLLDMRNTSCTELTEISPPPGNSILIAEPDNGQQTIATMTAYRFMG